MHIHLPIGLVPFGQDIILSSWRYEFYHGLFQTIIEAWPMPILSGYN
jgi:hypothetical protein